MRRTAGFLLIVMLLAVVCASGAMACDLCGRVAEFGVSDPSHNVGAEFTWCGFETNPPTRQERVIWRCAAPEVEDGPEHVYLAALPSGAPTALLGGLPRELAAESGQILIEPCGIAALSPDGLGGVALSVRVLERQKLWVDVGVISRDLDFNDWGFLTGVSRESTTLSDKTGGVIGRTGFGRDWRRATWLLYVTTDFEALF